jgi:hypothetical protein
VWVSWCAHTDPLSLLAPPIVKIMPWYLQEHSFENSVIMALQVLFIAMSGSIPKVEFFLFAISLVLVSLLCPQVASGQYGDYSIQVDIQIITGSKSPDFYVGDTFHYNITLTNIGTQPIDSNFTVNVYNPSRELLGTRIFERNLSPGQVAYLLPSKEKPVVQGNPEYDIFFFDSIGSYKLEVTSSQNLFFWRFTETEYTYQSSFTFYFDAMPRWEKNWRDRLAEWQVTNESLTKQALATSILLYRLTYVVGFLTVFSSAITAWSARRKVVDSVMVALVAFLVFAFVIWYFGIPWV